MKQWNNNPLEIVLPVTFDTDMYLEAWHSWHSFVQGNFSCESKFLLFNLPDNDADSDVGEAYDGTPASLDFITDAGSETQYNNCDAFCHCIASLCGRVFVK